MDDAAHLLNKLRQRDADAAQRLWELYYEQLVRLARRKLRDIPKGHVDEEDIAQSALRSFFVRAEQGQFDQIEDLDDL